jgi:hypothetical protein
MIWMTWRQHRKQLLFTALGLAALALFIVPTGVQMHNTFNHLGLANCLNPATASDACDFSQRQFVDQYSPLTPIAILFLLLPALLGLFWGAPIVAREVEHGTHRLAWTQGVSRRQWALTKFAFVGVCTAVFAVIYGLGMAWWLTPLSQAEGGQRFNPGLFDIQGIAPIGYTVFAVALGVFFGTVWPRVLVSMGATLAGVLGVRVAVLLLARPHYEAPVTLTSAIDAPFQFNDQGAWVLDNGIRSANGTEQLSHARIQCVAAPDSPKVACGPFGQLGPGAYNWEQLQPASRFWLFQGIETGIFVMLALGLFYLALRRVRRIA